MKHKLATEIVEMLHQEYLAAKAYYDDLNNVHGEISGQVNRDIIDSARYEAKARLQTWTKAWGIVNQARPEYAPLPGGMHTAEPDPEPEQPPDVSEYWNHYMGKPLDPWLESVIKYIARETARKVVKENNQPFGG